MTGLPASKDLSHHLSREAKARTPSTLKQTFKYVIDPRIVSLGGGLPMSQYFPFEELNATAITGPFTEKASSQENVVKIDVKKHESDGLSIPLDKCLQYGTSAGDPQLLKFCKEHIKTFHPPPYRDWDVILSVGSTHSWDSVMRLLVNPGESIFVEEYAFASALTSAHNMLIKTVPVEMDLEGIIPEKFEKQLENWQGPMPKILYTIPTGQNPTGGTLSNEKRGKIYKLAQKYDFIIVEDEPYYFLQMDDYIKPTQREKQSTESNGKSEITHDEFYKKMVKSYLSLDVDGRVIRLDSFSKIIAPGTRTGWISGREQFLERILRHHETSIQSPSGFSQTMLVGLLSRWGHDGFTDWLIHLRKEYTGRRDFCLDCMEEHFDKRYVEWIAPTAGMFFWIKVDASQHPQFVSLGALGVEKLLYEKGLEKGVLITRGSWFTCGQCDDSLSFSFFRGAFAAVETDKVEQGIKLFGQVLDSEFGKNK